MRLSKTGKDLEPHVDEAGSCGRRFWASCQLRWVIDANVVKRRGDGLERLSLTQHDLVLGLNILYAINSEECSRPLIPLLAPLYFRY